MTPIWHDGPLCTLAWDGRSPVVWSVAETGSIAADMGIRGDPRSVRADLARALLGRVSASRADCVRLARTPSGAPIVDAPEGWHIGLSSRGSQCLIAIARQPIAVDREIIDRHPPLWDMLTPTEAEELRRLPVSAQPREWLRRWTIKEAHAKLVGTPRRIAAEAIETNLAGPVSATAYFQRLSICTTRTRNGAIETVAQWNDRPLAPAP